MRWGSGTSVGAIRKQKGVGLGLSSALRHPQGTQQMFWQLGLWIWAQAGDGTCSCGLIRRQCGIDKSSLIGPPRTPPQSLGLPDLLPAGGVQLQFKAAPDTSPGA